MSDREENRINWGDKPVKANSADPVLKKSRAFREVTPSGVIAGEIQDIITDNQIGTIDGE